MFTPPPTLLRCFSSSRTLFKLNLNLLETPDWHQVLSTSSFHVLESVTFGMLNTANRISFSYLKYLISYPVFTCFRSGRLWTLSGRLQKTSAAAHLAKSMPATQYQVERLLHWRSINHLNVKFYRGNLISFLNSKSIHLFQGIMVYIQTRVTNTKSFACSCWVRMFLL